MPEPNRGDSVESWRAHPDLREDQSSWKARLGIDVEQQIRLVELNHIRYQHNDIERIVEFLQDFGMQVAKRQDDKIWFKGYGPHPYVYVVVKGDETKFLGGTFTVERYSDLERASKLRNSTAIHHLDNEPGGGHFVTMYDPAGFPINLIHGQAADGPDDDVRPPKLLLNYEQEKQRLGSYQRFSRGPAAVFRLGHFGICYNDYATAYDFYVHTFNLVPSDIVYLEREGKRTDVSSFLHIDRGDEFTDHHTFFLSSSKNQRVHHSSFEIHDFDTQLLGHQWLERKGYKIVWGVGRHLLGSQIFDYWWDTSGFMIEHYTDGDLVDSKTPVGSIQTTDEALQVWGPIRPVEFLA
ncbi:hypothetical protein NW759_017019 [Fusarium solani]|nr:hypothetical protein NW759_017019 [Fusarium solani]